MRVLHRLLGRPSALRRWASTATFRGTPTLDAHGEQEVVRTAESLLREGGYESLVRLYDRVRLLQASVPFKVRTCTVAALAELGAYSRCCEVYNSLCEEFNPTASLVSTVMKAAFLSGQSEDVPALFAQGVFFHPEAEMIYKSYGVFLFDQRRFDELLTLYRRMREQSVHVDAHLLSLVARAAIATQQFSYLCTEFNALPADLRTPIESHFLFSLAALHRYQELLGRLQAAVGSGTPLPSFFQLKLLFQCFDKLELPVSLPEGKYPLSKYAVSERMDDLVPLAQHFHDREFSKRVVSLSLLIAHQLSPSTTDALHVLALSVGESFLHHVLQKMLRHHPIWLGVELNGVFRQLQREGRLEFLQSLWSFASASVPSFINPNTVSLLLPAWEQLGRTTEISFYQSHYASPESGSALFALSLGDVLHARGDHEGFLRQYRQLSDSYRCLGGVPASRVLQSLRRVRAEGASELPLFRSLSELYLAGSPFLRMDVLEEIRSTVGESEWASLREIHRSAVELCESDAEFLRRQSSESIHVETPL